MTGRKASEETKKKMSETGKRKGPISESHRAAIGAAVRLWRERKRNERQAEGFYPYIGNKEQDRTVDGYEIGDCGGEAENVGCNEGCMGQGQSCIRGDQEENERCKEGTCSLRGTQSSSKVSESKTWYIFAALDVEDNFVSILVRHDRSKVNTERPDGTRVLRLIDEPFPNSTEAYRYATVIRQSYLGARSPRGFEARKSPDTPKRVKVVSVSRNIPNYINRYFDFMELEQFQPTQGDDE
jgi:hypothetical protein